MGHRESIKVGLAGAGNGKRCDTHKGVDLEDDFGTVEIKPN